MIHGESHTGSQAFDVMDVDSEFIKARGGRVSGADCVALGAPRMGDGKLHRVKKVFLVSFCFVCKMPAARTVFVWFEFCTFFHSWF